MVITANRQGLIHKGAPPSADSVLLAGGVATGLGALGVTLASVLYALSPPAAALPAQPLDPAAAIAGAIAGAVRMHAAGVVGMISDTFLATGALLVSAQAARGGRGWSAAGWIAIFVSVLIFIVVDVLVGHLLGPLAVTQGASGSFLGFKRLFDALFLLGTLTFGLGALVSMTDEYLRPGRWVSRPLALLGALTGLASFAAAAAGFCGLPAELAVGGGILLGGALFAAIGAHVAIAGYRATLPTADLAADFAGPAGRMHIR